MGRRAKYLTQEERKQAAREQKAQDIRTVVYVMRLILSAMLIDEL